MEVDTETKKLNEHEVRVDKFDADLTQPSTHGFNFETETIQEWEKEEEISQVTNTIPGTMQGVFFEGIIQPDLLKDYDVMGFDADHCLVRYNSVELTKTFVKLTLEDLVNNYKDYPQELLEFDFEKNKNVCNNNAVWDIHNGIILKIAEGGEIT